MKKKDSKVPRNLILVSRPINFLYAIEICSSRKNKDFLILIFPHKEESEMNAIEYLQAEFRNTLSNATFKKFQNYTGVGLLDLILFKIYLMLQMRKMDFDLISTSGGVKGRLLYKHLKFNHVLITDEGSTSLSRFPEIAKSGNLFPRAEGKIFQRVYRILNIGDLENDQNFSILTIYNNLCALSDKIHVNKFHFLKEIIDGRGYVQDEKEVIILGSHPHSLGMEEKKYISLMDKVVKEYRDFSVFLKPHKNFNKTYHFQPLKADMPIEYFFIKRKKIPQFLFSFGSTSNKVLEHLYPEITVKSFTMEGSRFYEDGKMTK